MLKRISALLLAAVFLSLCACEWDFGKTGSGASSLKSSSISAESSSAEAVSGEEISSVPVSSTVSSKISSKAASSGVTSKISETVIPEQIKAPETIAKNLEKPKETDQNLSPYTVISSDNYRLYNELTPDQKEVYNKMAKLAETMSTDSIELNSFNNLAEAGEFCQKVMKAFRSDNPQIFWLGQRYGFGMKGNTGLFSFTFQYTKEERDILRKSLEAKVKEIIGKIGGGLSEYERELAVYRWLCENVSYDHNAAEEYYSNSIHSLDPWTAYGALINGKAVCEGYSRAFQLLMYYLGIQASLITGKSQEQPHMWNIVCIENVWYQLDITWSDSQTTKNTEFINYTYFNISDELMMMDHNYSEDYSNWLKGHAKTINWESSELDAGDFNISLPACNSIEANYCVRNDLYLVGSGNASSLFGAGISKAIAEGRKSEFFMFAPGFNGSEYFDKNSGIILKSYNLNIRPGYVSINRGLAVFWN